MAGLNPIKLALVAGVVVLPLLLNPGRIAADERSADGGIKAAREAFEASDYSKAAQLLKAASSQDPRNGEIYLLLTKAYFESRQYDEATAAAEKAVALDPQNSVYHEWLGKVYGEKAGHASIFSALSLAKKARKEFAKGVELDEHNFSAHQALIEFDCSAPGVAGGGEDKARPEIAKLAELDSAEGHYAAGNCRRQKKDFTVADAEFAKALELRPKSADLIYDIGDYAMKQSQAETLEIVAKQGEEIDPSDARADFYRAVGLIIKNEQPETCERLLRQYLKRAPVRSTFPPPWRVHEWLGRAYENQHKSEAAIQEYEIALKLEPKNKNVREALKRLQKG